MCVIIQDNVSRFRRGRIHTIILTNVTSIQYGIFCVLKTITRDACAVASSHNLSPGNPAIARQAQLLFLNIHAVMVFLASSVYTIDDSYYKCQVYHYIVVVNCCVCVIG